MAAALAGCSLLVLSGAVPVQAQSWPEQSTAQAVEGGSAAVGELLQETEVSTLEPVVLEGPGGQIRASLEELIESPEGRGLDAVRLVGRATLSRETGEATITWNMIEAEGKRGEGSAALREGLRSQMPLRGAQLPRNSRVVAAGDVDDMVAVARRLLAELNAEEEEAEEGGLIERSGSAGADGAPGSGGGDDASAGYQPITPRERERDPDDPIVYSYTTVDGCEIRVDFGRGLVVQQERELELTDGRQSGDSGCVDSAVSFAIQYGTTGCPDAVDIAGRVARPQQRPFYTDGSGIRRDLGACAPMDDPSWPLIADFDSCEVAVDMGAGWVTRRRQLAYNNAEGIRQVVQGCAEEPEERLPIQYGRSSCADLVDIAGGVARPQHKAFYVAATGVRQDLGDCEGIEGEGFPLQADYAACSDLVDVSARQVTKRYQLGYRDGAGVFQVVGGCATDEAAVLAIEERTEGCDWVHDLSEDYSMRSARLVYAENGVVHPVTDCSALPDTRVDHRWDTEGCDPIVDLDGRAVTPRARRMLDYNGTSTMLSGCAPASWMADTLRSTFDGCADRLVHNVAGRQSFETWRWYHTVNGPRSYVTDCELAEAPPLPHQRQTVDWQHDDEQKRSTPLERIYVVSRAGEFEVSSPRVQADHVKQPYAFVRTRTVQVGPYYEGCDEYIERQRVEEYTRADGSAYHLSVGNASPLGPTDKCQRSTERRQFVERLHGTGSWTTAPMTDRCGNLNDPVAVLGRSDGGLTASLSCEGRTINCREGGGGDGGNTVCTDQWRLLIDSAVNDGVGRFNSCVVLRNRSLAVPNIRQEGRVEDRHVLIYPNGTRQNGSWETVSRFNQSLGCE